MTSIILQCPNCGEQSFNWILRIVQNGSVHEYDSGTRAPEGMSLGEVVRDEIEESGVWCNSCNGVYDMDELELPPETNDPDE